MYHGAVTTRKTRVPGGQRVLRTRLKSAAAAANSRITPAASTSATGPFASTARENMAAKGVSVEAEWANPTMPAAEAVISAPSRWKPGRNLQRNRYTPTTRREASKAEGKRAAQSRTPNTQNAPIACQ